MVPAKQDLWRVLLSTGETSMTLDALAEAFDAGRIDASTMVLEPGGIFWTTLGKVAGLDEPSSTADVEANVEVGVDVDVGELTRAPAWKRHALLAVPAAVALVAVIAFAASSASSSVDGRAAASHLAPAAPPVIAATSPASAAPAASSARPPNGPILVPNKRTATPSTDKPKTKRGSKR